MQKPDSFKALYIYNPLCIQTVRVITPQTPLQLAQLGPSFCKVIPRNHSEQCIDSPLQTKTYQVVALGRMIGLQTINRAELYALVQAAQFAHTLRSPHLIHVYTDSQFVHCIVQAVHAGAWLPAPHKQSNFDFDLISKLFTLWDATRFRIHKIKSHQELAAA